MPKNESKKDQIKSRYVSLCERSDIPEHMISSVANYVLFGDHVGGFLTKLFSDKLLTGAYNVADNMNRTHFLDHIKFILRYVPAGAYGDSRIVKDWIDSGGLYGLYKSQSQKYNTDVTPEELLREWMQDQEEKESILSGTAV